MCYDLSEYDPFEPLYVLASPCGYYNGEVEIDSEPMEDYNWEEWLEADYANTK